VKIGAKDLMQTDVRQGKLAVIAAIRVDHGMHCMWQQLGLPICKNYLRLQHHDAKVSAQLHKKN